jgi:hypothetical protein
MQNLKLSNRLLFAVAAIVYLVSLLFYAYYNYNYSKNEIMKNIDRELYHFAKSIKYVLPDDFHDRANDSQSITLEEDKILSIKLTKIVKDTRVKYLYTLIKKGNRLFLLHPILLKNLKRKEEHFIFIHMMGPMRNLLMLSRRKNRLIKPFQINGAPCGL